GHYQDAKVLLTVRSAESWFASFSKTILTNLAKPADSKSLGKILIGERTFGGRPGDAAHAKAVYEANIAAVKAEISPERLLVYELGSGWEPLCAFLGVPVPETPYPRTNHSVAFHASVSRLTAERAAKEETAK
ncbi:MAG: sulfotransferase family protein, partial [Pseudomonadota bacterium]